MNGSSRSLVAAVIGLLAFNPFYFILYLPLSEIHHTVYFFSSYAACAGAAAVVALIDAPTKKRFQRVMLLYVGLFFGSLIAVSFDPYTADFYVSVLPGFVTGVALAGCAVLMYRVKAFQSQQ